MSRMDNARGRLASLLSRAKVDDNELTGIDEAELQAELRARVAARKKTPPKPAAENPRSKHAGAAAGDTAKRAQMAERRRSKIHAVRNKRASARQAAEDEAFRRVKEQAAREPSPYARRPSSRASGSSNWRQRAKSGIGNLGRDHKVAGYYKVLDLPYGAPYDDVKSAFRKLMRKYHPDKHSQSPKKQKAATELTIKVTQAYNGLEEHFKNKP